MGPRLLLVRHGQTLWNEAGRYQGRSDPPLSAAGTAAAVELARTLEPTPLGRILSSPLRRAVQTARLIAGRRRLAIETDERLAELAFGGWEGLTQAEVKEHWPELLRLYKRMPEAVCFPGGETIAEAEQRLGSVLDALAVDAPAEPVLVVTHAALIRLALLRASERPLSRMREIAVAHCRPYPLERVGGSWRVAAETPAALPAC